MADFSKKVQIEIEDMYTAKVVLHAVIGVISEKRDQSMRVDKNKSFAALLEFADDLADEIVRVESWRDEDETE